MVITKTPFRVSFFGGGTDYPAWANENGGAVLSTTINKYCYITCRYLPPFFDYNYKIRYTDNEYVKTIAEIKHPSVRECLSYMNITERIEMQHNSDLPAMSGLGSSSAFTVGFLNALHALQGNNAIDKLELANQAIHVEQNLLKENVGSQDQVAAAIGGFNKIEFPSKKNGGQIKVTSLAIPSDTIKNLESRLMLFFTGFSRNASEIAADQIKNIHNKEKELKAIGAMVKEALGILSGGSNNLKEFGLLLNEAWKLKRGLSSRITNSHIDEMYEAAISAGAIGGKILGAGGGGFMLIFADPCAQPKIKEKLGQFLYVPFKFESEGSQVIFKIDNEPIHIA